MPSKDIPVTFAIVSDGSPKAFISIAFFFFFKGTFQLSCIKHIFHILIDFQTVLIVLPLVTV